MKLILATALLLAAPSAAYQALLQGGRGLRASLRGLDAHGAAAASRTDQAAYLQVEAEDRRFWLSELNTLEADLLRLEAAAAPAPANSTAKVAAAAAPPSSNSTAPAPAAANATAPSHEHHSLLKGIKMNLNPKSTADLIPALAMLKGLYESGKDRIAELNTREQESKNQFEDRQAVHNARLATIEARGKNHTLSAEFVRNETFDENRLWNYWERVRERQHHQFHTSLNIQHGMMQRVKTMIDAYERAIAGQASSDDFKKDMAAIGGLAFLQQAKQAAASFCQDALAQLQEARSSLQAAAVAGALPRAA